MTLPVSKGLSGLGVFKGSHPNQNTHLYTGLYSGRVETLLQADLNPMEF